MNQQTVYHTALELCKSIEEKEFNGYDPYDFKSNKKYLKYIAPNKLLKNIFEGLNIFFPKLVRNFFGVKPEFVFSGSLGYMLEGYCLLYHYDNNNIWLEKAKKVAIKLMNISNQKYPGLSWGLNIDWKSSTYILDKNTPNVVNTSEVASGFYELYIITKDEEYKNVLFKIVEFYDKGLKVTYDNDTSICLSYTPVDDYQVHNANLLAAGILSKLGKLFDRKDWLEKAKKMANFAINDLSSDGFLKYQASTSKYKKKKPTDLYHSGYELRNISQVYDNTPDNKILEGLELFIKSYKLYFFKNKYPITSTQKGVDFVNTHGCAEAIYCTSLLSHKFKDFSILSEKIVDWTLKNMMKSKGEFINQRLYFSFLSYKSSISFMRWNNTVMFRALGRYLYEKKQLFQQ